MKLIGIGCAALATADIRIAPTESAPGARDKYTMRVANDAGHQPEITHEPGDEREFIGPVGSRLPSPAALLKKPDSAAAK
jgi:hypothetical protein